MMKKKTVVFIPIALVLVLTIHFSIVLISVIPYSPIYYKTNTIVSAYVNPLFTQVWTLFAPDPVNSNDALQIKLELNDGTETDWIDATNPLVEKMYPNYLSPYNRMGRITQSITSQMFTEDPISYELRKSLESKKNTEKSLKALDKNHQKQYEQFEEYLLRYGSAYAKYLFPNKDIKTIEMRVLKQDSIPFSKRNDNVERPWQVIAEIEKKTIPKDVLPLM